MTRGASLQGSLHGIIEKYLLDAGISDESALMALGMKERTTRQRLFVEKAMATGEGFEAAFTKFFVADKFGTATTHWSKLQDRIAPGVGNPCPLLLIGLPDSILRPGTPASKPAPDLFSRNT